MIRGDDDDLGARVEDVAQEAVDATALTYANDPAIDVEEHLREQLESRGLATTDDETLTRLAQQIRGGHPVRIGEPDGSVE